jgi:hypothetical protein
MRLLLGIVVAGGSGAMGAFASTDPIAQPIAPSLLAANQPMGVAKGVFPGRVVWVHDPNAVNQDCVPDAAGHAWFLPENNRQTVIDGLVSTALRSLTGDFPVPQCHPRKGRGQLRARREDLHQNQRDQRVDREFQSGRSDPFRLHLRDLGGDRSGGAAAAGECGRSRPK